MKPFANEPILELRRAPVRAQLGAALERVDRMLPLEVPVWIAGDAQRGDGLLSTDPGSP
jgi:RHH-type proline utilization regulon transcriptional repressor/proline dehydrogenase/delta 1-pyrroline-5-carboxylate dehydrogenase